MAKQAVMKSGNYAYIGRRQKKRDFRRLWITRISAACKLNGLNYSTFMHGLKLAQVEIDRKMLSELAVNDAAAIADRILTLGEPAVADYKKFLSGGSSTDPIGLLKIAGVDMSSPAPVNAALKLFGELVDELEKLG